MFKQDSKKKKAHVSLTQEKEQKISRHNYSFFVDILKKN